MRQDRDETIRSFGARIRGQANVCRFSITCTNCEQEVNYTDAILRDVLTRGMSDPEIQLDLLSDSNQDMTLEEAFKFIEAKEAGKRSAKHLIDSQGADATRSSYKQEKRALVKPDDQCGYCGKKGHGKSAPVGLRKKSCPAYNHTCLHCGIPNHYDSMCRNKDKPRRKPYKTPVSTDSMDNDECEGAVFDALCTISTFSQQRGHRTIHLDHHIYDNMCQRWIRQKSKSQPFVKVNAAIHPKDYQDFGFTRMKSTLTTTTYAMADTGCQSCLAGIKAVRHLGLTEKDLIPVSMKMHAANNKGIKILGAAIVRYSGLSDTGQTVETRQITYVTDSSDKIFLSREACEGLGMISPSFPKIGEVQTSAHVIGDSTGEGFTPTAAINNHGSSNIAPCGCLKREAPPSPPNKLPFQPTEGNREKLQDFLLDYYKSSTFNTCEHQPLPMMDVPPLKLMVDNNAKPVAFHKAIPVPLHWQSEIKAGLDRDVRLGVLEQVPVGEPVTWCHRMVVCAKKDGTPRRTGNSP